MRMNRIIAKLRGACRRFAGAEEGNTLVTFALAFIPLVGFTGAAVDYSRAQSVQTAMQAAADTTALMIAQSANSETSDAIQSQASSYYSALFKRAEASNLSVTATYTTTSGPTVVVNATATYKTSFMGVIGFSSLPLAAASTASWGNARLRVALVLDNTGSMAQSGKLTALKTATNNLLTQLKNAATTNGDVYVSIVPFVRDVKVDPVTNYTGTWIDWTDWEAEPPVLDTTRGGSKPSTWDQTGPGSSCPFSNSSQGFTCTTGPATGGGSSAWTIPSSGNYSGLICPSMDSGRNNALYSNIYYNGCYDSTTYSCTGSSCTCTGHSNCSCTGSGSGLKCKTNSGYYEHTWRPAANTYATPAHSTWNGCVADRGNTSGPDTTNNYDTNVGATVSGTQSSYFPAQQYSVCNSTSTGLQPMMALTYDWTALGNLVNAMVANGSTNQAVGLVEGWQSLAGGGPFPAAPALDPNYTYQQVIILLTDGLNTQDRWYGDGSSTSTQVDARQSLTCTNIKNAGITIYTIQVNTDGSPTSTLLQNCATDTSKFFLLTSANEIVTTFNTIGTNLAKLRIAK